MEQCTGNQTDDRKFCRTWDKGGCHNGHLAVAVIFNGTACLNSRNAAAQTDQHWDKGFTRQTKTTENTVHDKGNTCHVTTVFQKCEQQEKNHHLRQEAKYSTDTGDDTIQNQRLEPWSGIGSGEPSFHCWRNYLGKQNIIDPVGHHRSHSGDGKIVNYEHDQRKDRKRENAVCNNLIDFIAGGKSLFCLLFLIAGFENAGNCLIALMSDDAFCIVIKFTFGFLTQCFDLIQYSCGKVELFHCFFIAFKKLDCKPAKIVWITASGNLFLNHRKSFFQFWVEGKRFWCKRFSLSKGQRCFCNLSASFSFQSTGLDNLTAKSL